MLKKYPIIINQIEEDHEINSFVRNENNFTDLKCVCCGSNNFKTVFINDNSGISQNTVLCKNCGFLYLNPRLNKKSLDFFYSSGLQRRLYLNKAHDSSKWKLAESFKRKKSIKEKFEQLDFINYIEESGINYKTVFEIGAASGYILSVFKSLNKKVLGNELNPHLHKIAKKKE